MALPVTSHTTTTTTTPTAHTAALCTALCIAGTPSPQGPTCNAAYCSYHGTATKSTYDDCDCQCTAGYTGLQCNACAEDYISSGSSCIACSNSVHCNRKAISISSNDARTRCECRCTLRRAAMRSVRWVAHQLPFVRRLWRILLPFRHHQQHRETERTFGRCNRWYCGWRCHGWQPSRVAFGPRGIFIIGPQFNPLALKKTTDFKQTAKHTKMENEVQFILFLFLFIFRGGDEMGFWILSAFPFLALVYIKIPYPLIK